MLCNFFFFFFQAEDGIRDYKVTGVQTCALPICAEVNTQNFASAEVCSPRVTSLQSQRLRWAPANGATSVDCGNRLMKSGTMRVVPTHGQNISTLPVSPSPLDRDDCLPKVCDGFCALVGLKPDAAPWLPL